MADDRDDIELQENDEQLQHKQALDAELSDAYLAFIKQCMAEDIKNSSEKAVNAIEDLKGLDTLETIRLFALQYYRDRLQDIPASAVVRGITEYYDDPKLTESDVEFFDSRLRQWFITKGFFEPASIEPAANQQDIPDEPEMTEAPAAPDADEIDALLNDVIEDIRKQVKENKAAEDLEKARAARYEAAKKHYIEATGDDLYYKINALPWYDETVSKLRIFSMTVGLQPGSFNEEEALKASYKEYPDDETVWNRYYDRYIEAEQAKAAPAEEPEVSAEDKAAEEAAAAEEARAAAEEKIRRQTEKEELEFSRFVYRLKHPRADMSKIENAHALDWFRAETYIARTEFLRAHGASPENIDMLMALNIQDHPSDIEAWNLYHEQYVTAPRQNLEDRVAKEQAAEAQKKAEQARIDAENAKKYAEAKKKLEFARSAYLAENPGADMSAVTDGYVLTWFKTEADIARYAYASRMHPGSIDIDEFMDMNIEEHPDDVETYELYHEKYITSPKQYLFAQKVYLEEHPRTDISAVTDEDVLNWFKEEVYTARSAYVSQLDNPELRDIDSLIKSNIAACPSDEVAYRLYRQKYVIDRTKEKIELSKADYLRANPNADPGIMTDKEYLERFANEAYRARVAYLSETVETPAIFDKLLDVNMRRYPDDLVVWKKYHEKYIAKPRDERRAEIAKIRAKAEERRAAEKAEAERKKLEEEKENAEREKALEELRPKLEKIREMRKEAMEAMTGPREPEPEPVKNLKERFAEEYEKSKGPDCRSYFKALGELKKDLDSTKSALSNDSDEFKATIRYLDAVCSISELNSRQLKEVFNAVKVAVKAYNEHAAENPRPGNKRRNTRLGIMAKLDSLADDFANGVKNPKEKSISSVNEHIKQYLTKVARGQYSPKTIGEIVDTNYTLIKELDSMSTYQLSRVTRDQKAFNKLMENNFVKEKAKTSAGETIEFDRLGKH